VSRDGNHGPSRLSWAGNHDDVPEPVNYRAESFLARPGRELSDHEVLVPRRPEYLRQAGNIVSQWA
jgi:hypothetical protein